MLHSNSLVDISIDPTGRRCIPDARIDDEYVERIRLLAPGGVSLKTSPSLRQCVGTNRLWGPSLGYALADDLEVDQFTRQNLVDIAVLSRTVLVLEDFLDDELIGLENMRQSVGAWIDNTEVELERAYTNIGEDFTQHLELRRRSRDAMRRRCQSIDSGRVYDLSIGKCLIFFNPYRLHIATNHPMFSERMRFLEVFFFACQLLDDFQDLRQDRNKLLNHNIFLAHRPQREQDAIITYRMQWLRSVLYVIRYNFEREDVIAGTNESSVFIHFYDRAKYYLDKLLSDDSVGRSVESQIETQLFENWSFDPLDVVGEMVKDTIEPLVRPEILQTYAIGIHRIEDV